MLFPKYSPNVLRGVGDKLSNVSENCHLLGTHFLSGISMKFGVIAVSVHQSVEGCPFE